MCKADLVTGRRDSIDEVMGLFMLVLVYVLHVFVATGMVMVGVAILMPGFGGSRFLAAAALVTGPLLGLALAEHSRRTGALLGRSRRRRR